MIWIYQDVRAIYLKDIPPTQLIIHRIWPCKGTKIHNAKYKKLLQDCEWWLCRIIEESMDVGMYKRTVTANDCLSKWNANLVFIFKPGQKQPQLIINYHLLYENLPASHIEAAANVCNLLGITLYQCLFLADIKYGYC